MHARFYGNSTAFLDPVATRLTIKPPHAVQLFDNVKHPATTKEHIMPAVSFNRLAVHHATSFLCAVIFSTVAVGQDIGGTTFAPKRPWDPGGDCPAEVSTDKSVKFDYPIVYVRAPRPYPKEYLGINHLNQAGLHQTNAPGAELRLLYPDGRDESLVSVAERESITDPVVSFDGQWVYFAKFHHMATGSAHMTKLRSREGADIYKIHVPTRKLFRLTEQPPTPNTGAVPKGAKSHPHGVHNLAPGPVAGGKVVFCSDRNGYRGVREQTRPALQLFVMDDDQYEKAIESYLTVVNQGPIFAWSDDADFGIVECLTALGKSDEAQKHNAAVLKKYDRD